MLKSSLSLKCLFQHTYHHAGPRSNSQAQSFKITMIVLMMLPIISVVGFSGPKVMTKFISDNKWLLYPPQNNPQIVKDVFKNKESSRKGSDSILAERLSSFAAMGIEPYSYDDGDEVVIEGVVSGHNVRESVDKFSIITAEDVAKYPNKWDEINSGEEDF